MLRLGWLVPVQSKSMVAAMAATTMAPAKAGRRSRMRSCGTAACCGLEGRMKGGLPAAAVAEGPKAHGSDSFWAQLPRPVEVGQHLGVPGQAAGLVGAEVEPAAVHAAAFSANSTSVAA